MITHFQNDARGNKKGGPDQDHPKISAAKAAKLAQDLPDRAAVAAVRIEIEEKHLRTSCLDFVSRGHSDCNHFVTFNQAVNVSNIIKGGTLRCRP